MAGSGRLGVKRPVAKPKGFRRHARRAQRLKRTGSTQSQHDPVVTPGIISAPNARWGPLGKSYKASLRVAFTISLDPVTGGTADHIFSANGIAKPDISDVTSSQQCYSHDQLVPFFDHYTVIGSKCTVTAANNNEVPIYIGCALRDSSTAMTSSNNLLRAMPNTNLILCNFNSGSDSLRSTTMTYSPNRFFGKSKGNVVGESELRGQMNLVASTTDNPTEQAYYHVLVSAQTDNDNPTTQAVQVEIEYTVVLTEPKQLASSS